MSNAHKHTGNKVAASADMQAFLRELAALMERYNIVTLEGAYGDSTDTHGIHDEHFKISHCSGFSVRNADFSQTIDAGGLIELANELRAAQEG